MMANRLFTPQEFARELIATANRVAAEHGLDADQKAKLLYAVGSGIGHMPYQGG